ncbi:hypothetical protein CF134_17670 [Aeromonas salmonicida]|nr:hypothetical protein CF134_17670 [Aeromonas salmonicida]
MKRCKKKCAGKNAKRSHRENERKLLQQVGSRESKLMTCIKALAEISKFGYYFSLMQNADVFPDMSSMMHWLISFVT